MGEMTIFELPDATPTVLQALPAEVLMHLQQQAAEHVAAAGKLAAIIHDTLAERYARGLNKTGVTHIGDGPVDVSVTIPKRVKWDQTVLRKAVEQIVSWGEDPDDYVEIEIKVPERKYDAWPPAIRDLFTPGRTVESGKPSFKLALGKKAAA